MKGFYNGLKEVWGPKKKGPVQLKSTDGMETFSDSKRVVARWSEHFQKLLNVPGDIDHEALDNIPQRITKTSLDEIPTMDEMARAIASLKDGKAPGGDGIPAEVWKHGGDNLFSRLHQLITNAWEMGSVPQAWKDASIITIYKKGDRTDCGNYRGISLLSIAGKIFARILLNRLSTHLTKSRNRSGSQMGSSKAVYWRPRSFPSSYQQCSTMLSETWGMASTYSPDRALTYSMSHTSERRPRLHGY